MPAPIKSFDREACRLVGDEVGKALAAALEPFGLSVKVSGGTFAEGKFTPKVTISVAGGEQVEFARLASLVHLEADDYERVFTSNGRSFRISGINLKARTYPVNAVCVEDGKNYKFSASKVRVALGRSANWWADEKADA